MMYNCHFPAIDRVLSALRVLKSVFILRDNLIDMYENRYTTAPPKSKSEKSRGVRAPFGYYGAKLRLVSRIMDGLPPHNAWVEAFCGSAALTLAKRPAPIEVINDLDNEIVNVFKQLRNNSAALCKAIALTPYARAEFQHSRLPKRSSNSLERARRFLVSTMMTMNATYGSGCAGFSFSQSYARQDREARVSRWYNLPDRLEKVVERLKNVRIENRDARGLLQMFSNRPATLVPFPKRFYDFFRFAC